MHCSASTHVHLFCIPTYVSWCELNAHPAWLMPSHVRQNVCDFHYLRENIYIFSSTYLRSFFHSSACTLCSLSLLFYYIRPSSILNSPRFHAYCYLPSFCLSRASPGHYSDGPFFRQCKIELNPQIHGLTRCIQQDVPSVRLILTNHGLDRMFWKGKGAFILPATAVRKAVLDVFRSYWTNFSGNLCSTDDGTESCDVL
jgi:hypothetical protein